MKPYSVLMVCMGNICSSPIAHGVLRHNGVLRVVPLHVTGLTCTVDSSVTRRR
jgi:protein-tyrosine-phosphatase